MVSATPAPKTSRARRSGDIERLRSNDLLASSASPMPAASTPTDLMFSKVGASVAAAW